MFELTRQEKALITFVLLSLLVGSIVRHYRQIYRENHPAPSPAQLLGKRL